MDRHYDIIYEKKLDRILMKKQMGAELDMDIDKVLSREEDELFALLDNPPAFKVDKDFEKTKEKISQRAYVDEVKQKELARIQAKEKLLQRKTSKMNDPQFKYAYHTEEKILHDKSCKMIRKIPIEYFDMLREIDYKMKFCAECHVRALIRNCIDDQNDIDIVENFLKKSYAKREDIFELFSRKSISVKCLSSRTLELKVNDDKWKIIISDENEKLVLMHNNYRIENSKRIMEEGFHKQTINGRPTFKVISRIIIDYKSRFHIEEARRLDKEEKYGSDIYLEMAPDNDIEIDNDYFKIVTAVRLKKFAIFHYRYMFIDTKAEHYKKVLKNRKIRYKTVSSIFSNEFVYGVIVCDIPKWYKRKIFAAMNRIKSSIYKEGHGRAYLCGMSMIRYLDKNKIKFEKHL